MGRVAIFIDGGYLEYVQRSSGDPRVAFDKLALTLAHPDELLRTYYYHCLPYQSPSPTPDEMERFARRQRFFHGLRRLDRFEVREGKLALRGWDRTTGRPILEQKRVDIMLAVDLVLLATKRQITRWVIVTGDSDFLAAIQAAKNEGVVIHGGALSVAPRSPGMIDCIMLQDRVASANASARARSGCSSPTPMAGGAP